MRRILIIALAAAGAVTSPASAALGCDNPGQLEVIDRDGLTSSTATPSFLVANETESKEFLVDLGEGDLTADLTVILTWSIPVNDYDLAVVGTNGGGGTSDGYQPFDPAVESVSLAISNCETVVVDVIDFLAPVVIDTIALDFDVTNVTGG